MTLDEATRIVIEHHLAYTGDLVMDQGITIQGSTFWQVGRNASHEFYLGVIDGKLYRYSIGEAGLDAEGDMTYQSRLVEVQGDDVGYIGHF